MQKITKAIIAVAGSGTRLLPATKSTPKEMLPIIDKPIIQIIVEELVEAWIEDIIFVTRWDKKPLEDHFDRSIALEEELISKWKGKTGDSHYHKIAWEVKYIAEMANFIYVRQKGPYWNWTPILSASSLVKNEPFVFVFWDDLVKSEVSFTKQMIEDYNKNWHLMIWVQEVPLEVVNKYWIVKIREGTTEIEDIIEKPSIEEAPSRLADFGRMILNQDFIDILKKTSLGKDNELWVIDAIKTYVQNWWIFIAKELKDWKWLTTWDPSNYLKTILEYANNREDLQPILNDFIKSKTK